MADYVRCSNCHKRIREGIPFCPHCGDKKASTGISNEFDEDPYVILQVSSNAEPEVINAAYKQLAKKYHPDNYPSFSSEERMKQINWAFGIVGNINNRQEYDRTHYPEKERKVRKAEEERKRQNEEKRKREDERRKREEERRKQEEKERIQRKEQQKVKVSEARRRKENEQKEKEERQKRINEKGKKPLDKKTPNPPFISIAIGILILVIIILLIVASNKNQISRQATKTPTVQKTITKQSDYPTIAENNKDYGEIPALWEYANEIIEGESITEHHVSGLDSDIVKIEWGWCSKNMDLLEENWKNIDIRFKIGKNFVSEDNIKTITSKDEAYVEGLGFVPGVCNEKSVTLANWLPGVFDFEVVVKFSNDINDGWEDYSEGLFDQIIYKVEIKEKPNDFVALPKFTTNSGLSIETLRESNKSIFGGAPHLLEYAEEPTQIGNDFIYTVNDFNQASAIWVWMWCADSMARLNENLDSTKVEYKVNEQIISEDYFHNYTFITDEDYFGSGTDMETCKFTRATITDWQPGNYELRIELSLDKEIDNGWDIYPKNWLINWIYKVNVVSSSADGPNSNIIQSTSSANSPNSNNNQPTSSANRDCKLWSQVEINDIGKKLCVYGEIIKLNQTTEYPIIARFSQEPGTFIIRGPYRGFDFSSSKCIKAEGIVKKDITYLYMDTDEIEITDFDGCKSK